MTRYAKQEIKQRINELGREQTWHHRIELPYGIVTTDKKQVTHGKNTIKWSRVKEYIDTIDLKGKRVLDVGCGEGFFSLKLAKMGAREVVAVDADELRIKKARYVSEILGTSNITYEVANIFNTCIEIYGHFDFALCMGFLHRIPYPYEAIQQLTSISDTIFFEWKSLREGNYDLPVMKYCGGKSKDSNQYSGLYWLPSTQCVVDILEDFGFRHNIVIDNSPWRRAIIISSRFDNPIFKIRNIIKTSKFSLSQKVTKAYLRSIFKILKNKSIKWF